MTALANAAIRRRFRCRSQKHCSKSRLALIFCAVQACFSFSSILVAQTVQKMQTVEAVPAAPKQVRRAFALGVFGSGEWLQHRSSVQPRADLPELLPLTNGSALGFQAGVVLELPLFQRLTQSRNENATQSDDLLSLSLRAAFAQRPHTLQRQMSFPNVQVFEPVLGQAGQTGQVEQAEIDAPSSTGYQPALQELRYNARQQALVGELSVLVKPLYRLVPELPVFVRIGAEAAFNLPSSLSSPSARTFTIDQTLVNAPTRTFPDDTRSRALASGVTPFASAAYSVVAGLGAEILIGAHPTGEGALGQRTLGGHLRLAPEIGVRMGLSSQMSSQISSQMSMSEWRSNALYASLAAKWCFYEITEPLDNTNRLPANNDNDLRKDVLVASIASEALEVQETVVTQTFPLLPYIFFDSASAVLQRKYSPAISTKSGFVETLLPKETLPIYYHMLHIVGKRLRDSPAAVLTLTGTTDGSEWELPAQRQLLARQRAKAVAAFLSGVWNIPERRIRIDVRDIPASPSSSVYAEGSEENRRVELSCSAPEILAPVIHSRFLEYTPSRATLGAQVLLRNPSDAASYLAFIEKTDGSSSANPSANGSANASTNANTKTSAHKKTGAPISVLRGTGVPPTDLRFSLPEKLSEHLAERIQPSDSLRCRVEILTHSGATTTGETMLPVTKTRSAFEVSRLSLIVFDFDKSDIGEPDKALMKRFVDDAVITQNSTAYVTGSTDKLGEAAYNLTLSQDRANAVQSYLRQIQPSMTLAAVRGTGAAVLPYDNSLPEGRYYCRTVSVVVRTPASKH
jgi:outer membrane protein OmpA-like peptidoglycan-associated protein